MQTEPLFFRERFLQWVAYATIGLPTLLLTVNSYDSGIVKTPVFVLLAGALLVLFAGQALWRGQLVVRKSPADPFVVLFLLLIVASAMWTRFRWDAGQVLPVWLSYGVCFFAGTHLFSTPKSTDMFMRTTAVIAALVCVFGLMQFLFPDQPYLEFFIGNDRRVGSTLTNPIYLSGYIVLIFPALLGFALSTGRTSRERRAVIVLLLCLAFLLVTTATRSSLIAFVLTTPLFVIISGMVRRKILSFTTAGVVLAVVGAMYFSPSFSRRVEATFANDQTSTLIRRIDFWEAGFRTFKQAPFFGHGIGSFEQAILDFRSPDYWISKSEDLVPHAHNEFVETAVDLGATGLVVYVVIVVTVLFTGLRQRTSGNGRAKPLRVGLACSIIAILIDNIANMSLRVVPIGAHAWIFMGILVSWTSRQSPSKSIVLRVPKLLAYFPICVWLVFAAWYAQKQIPLINADGHIIKAILAKDPSTAITEYRSALVLDPHSLIARSNLILVLLKAGRLEEVLSESKALRELSPHYPKSNLVQAAALARLRRYDEALKRLDVEISLRSHPDAFYYQWIAYNALGDTKGEIKSLEDLLQTSVKGRLLYQSEQVAARIRSMTLSAMEAEKFRSLYVQLQNLFPADQTVVAMVNELTARVGYISP